MQRLAFSIIGALGMLLTTAAVDATEQIVPPIDVFSTGPATSAARAPQPAHTSPAARNQLQEAPSVGPPPPNWVPQRHNLPLAYTPEGEPIIITPAATALGNLNDKDRAFVHHMIVATNGDLALAKLARQRAAGHEARTLAQTIIRDESNAVAALRSLVEPRGVTVSAATTSTYQAEQERLEKTGGTRFDREYLQGQLQHHLVTVNLLRIQADQGRDVLLHSWTLHQIPIFERHIQVLRELLGVHTPGV